MYLAMSAVISWTDRYLAAGSGAMAFAQIAPSGRGTGSERRDRSCCPPLASMKAGTAPKEKTSVRSSIKI